MMRDAPRLVIVTDLDGTLLGARDYSCSGARGTLARLQRDGIPLVFCSSKTRAEIERCRQDLDLDHPFISENGGALFVPDGYFPFASQPTRRLPGLSVFEFGERYQRVLFALRAAERESGVQVIGFRDLSVPQLARTSGLSLREAQLALLREYDEPFHLPDGGESGFRLFRALRRGGISCTRGGRYHHAHASPGKGHAVKVLRGMYERYADGPVLMIGLGDALNDVAMLRAVDVAIVVPGQATASTMRVLRRVPGARLAPGLGPAGWSRAVRELLRASAGTPLRLVHPSPAYCG